MTDLITEATVSVRIVTSPDPKSWSGPDIEFQIGENGELLVYDYSLGDTPEVCLVFAASPGAWITADRKIDTHPVS